MAVIQWDGAVIVDEDVAIRCCIPQGHFYSRYVSIPTPCTKDLQFFCRKEQCSLAEFSWHPKFLS